MTGVLHPARVRRPSNEWLPASDDRNRAHRVACRPYASQHGKVQHECRLNYRLMSKLPPPLDDPGAVFLYRSRRGGSRHLLQLKNCRTSRRVVSPAVTKSVLTSCVLASLPRTITLSRAPRSFV